MVVAGFTFLLLLLPERFNKMILVVVGGFLAAGGAFLTGPSQLLGLPNSIDLIKAGMMVSGIGKALIQSFVVAYIMQCGQEAFPEKSEEVERKLSILMSFSLGLSAFLIPVGMSGIFKVFGFRATLNTLGGLFTINAFVFLLHAARINWGRRRKKLRMEGKKETSLSYLRKTSSTNEFNSFLIM